MSKAPQLINLHRLMWAIRASRSRWPRRPQILYLFSRWGRQEGRQEMCRQDGAALDAPSLKTTLDDQSADSCPLVRADPQAPRKVSPHLCHIRGNSQHWHGATSSRMGAPPPASNCPTASGLRTPLQSRRCSVAAASISPGLCGALWSHSWRRGQPRARARARASQAFRQCGAPREQVR